MLPANSIASFGKGNDMTARFKCDERSGTNLFDALNPTNLAPVSNMAWVSPGKQGPYALALNGNNFATINNSSYQALPQAAPFSLGFWFKATNFTSERNMLVCNETFDSAGNGSGFRIAVRYDPTIRKHNIRFWTTDSGGNIFLSSLTVVSLNVWYGVYVTYDGTTVALYVNGKKEASGVGLLKCNNRSLALGAAMHIGWPGLCGAMDDIRFYRRALMEEEISLTGYWKFDQASSPTTPDECNSGATATLIGPAQLGASARFGARALELNGNGAWCRINNPNHSLLPETGQPFSISFWFKGRRFTNWNNMLLCNESSSGGFRMAVRKDLKSSKTLLQFWSNESSGTLALQSTNQIQAGRWYLATVTYDGTNGCLFLDGSLESMASGLVKGTAADLRVGEGAMMGWFNFDGLIDDLRIYSQVIGQDYMALTAGWRFEGFNGRACPDDSGFNNTLTVAPGVTTGTGRCSGEALKFSGRENSYIAVPNPNYAILPKSGEPFCLSLAFNASTLAGEFNMLCCNDTRNKNGFRLAIRSDAAQGKSVVQCWSTESGGTLFLQSVTPIQSNQWYRLVFNYSGTRGELYINGVREAAAEGAMVANGNNIYLGTGVERYPFRGTLDDIRFYARMLQTNEFGGFDPTTQADTLFVTVSTNGTASIRVSAQTSPLIKSFTSSIVQAPAHGSLTTVSNMLYTYTPTNGYVGPDVFLFRVTDSQGASSTGSANISVVRELYLSNTGSGNRSGSSAGNAMRILATDIASLENLLSTNKYYYRFHYAPGTYTVSGLTNLAFNGCKHLGAGAATTTIQMYNTSGIGVIFYPVWTSAPMIRDFEIGDLTLDCNANECPGFPTKGKSFTAIGMSGNNILIRDTIVKGFGTGAGRECFPVFLSVGGGSGGVCSNNVVTNVVFSSPATNNQDGLTCLIGGGVRTRTGIWTIVNHRAIDCRVIDVVSDFKYCQAFTFPVVDHCFIDGCTVGCYYEPGSGGTMPNPDFQQVVTVRNSIFTNVAVPVLAAFFNQEVSSMTGLVVENNTFSCSPLSSYAGIRIYSKRKNNYLQSLTVRDNVIQLNPSSPIPNQACGIKLDHCLNVTIERNLINMDRCDAALSNTTKRVTFGNCRGLVYDTNSVSWKSLQGNRDVSGARLGVRLLDDSAAPRQQSP